MATRETKIRSIPGVPDGLSEDMTDFLSAVKEILEVREGNRANLLDKTLLRSDLRKIGIDPNTLNQDDPSYVFIKQAPGQAHSLTLYNSLTILAGQNIELHGSGGEKAQLAIDTQNAERTLDLSENLKVLDGQDIELHASGGEKAQLDIDTQNAERKLDLSENLIVADGFNFTLQALGQANSMILNENLTIGDGHPGTITFSAASKVLTIDETATLSTKASVGSISTPIFWNMLTAAPDVVGQGTWVRRVEPSSLYQGDLYNSSNADGDNITLNFRCPAGTYTLRFNNIVAASRGIVDVDVDAVEKGSFDNEGAADYTNINEITGIVLTAGAHTLKFRVDGQTGAGYYCNLSGIYLQRTA